MKCEQELYWLGSESDCDRPWRDELFFCLEQDISMKGLSCNPKGNVSNYF